MSDDQVFDFEEAIKNMSDDMDIFKEIVQVFISDTPKTLSTLQEAFDKKDLNTIYRMSHSLKSSSRTVGGARLSKVSADLEACTKGNAVLPSMQESISKMKEEFSLLEHELRQKIEMPVS